MVNGNARRRVLVAAAALGPMQDLFCQEPLERWEILETDSFPLAHFTLQYTPCDLLLVNDDLLEREGDSAMAWLAFQRPIPMVYLSGNSPERLAKALELGIAHCLPRATALAAPSLLDRALEQALHRGQMERRQQELHSQLSQTRRHVDRLVNLLWRTTPGQGDLPWYTQRHMMERLQEELARAGRHQMPLTVAVGELSTEGRGEETIPVPDWATEVIVRSKRRSDVAGQYGPNGFMLLLGQTTEKGGLECCRRLRTFLEQPAPVPEAGAAVRACFGLASTESGEHSPQAVLRLAEENLQAARNHGEERIIAS